MFDLKCEKNVLWEAAPIDLFMPAEMQGRKCNNVVIY